MLTHNHYNFFFNFYKKNYNYVKKNSSPHNYEKEFYLLNIGMVNQGLNLSLNELRLIAEHRNISDYEKKICKRFDKST